MWLCYLTMQYITHVHMHTLFSITSPVFISVSLQLVLTQNQTSWVLSSMAALYWRVKGQGKRAIDCLRQALNYAPHHMKVTCTSFELSKHAILHESIIDHSHG